MKKKKQKEEEEKKKEKKHDRIVAYIYVWKGLICERYHRALNRMGATESVPTSFHFSVSFLCVPISVPLYPDSSFSLRRGKGKRVCIWVIQLPAKNAFIDGIYFSGGYTAASISQERAMFCWQIMTIVDENADPACS